MYSLDFVTRGSKLECFVRTWEGRSIRQVCVLVEDCSKSVLDAELTCLARVKSAVRDDSLPICVRGGSSVLTSVLNANREDGRKFVAYRDFTDSTMLKCYQLAYSEVFGMIDVISLLEYLLLRLRPACEETWMENLVALRRCIDAGQLDMKELRQLCDELLTVWPEVRHFVRYSGILRGRERSDAVGISLLFMLQVVL